MAQPSRHRPLLNACYVVAFMVFVDQGVQLAVSIFPYHPAVLQWRFGAFGVALGYATSLLLADLLIFVAASALDHRRFLRIWGTFHIAVAAALAGALIMFLMDAMQMRLRVGEDFRTPLIMNVFRVTLTASMLIAYAAFAAVWSWRRQRRPASAPPIPGLVVGTGG